MTNTIAVFQISTEEDLRFQLDFVGLDLAGRVLKVNVRERDSGLLKVSLEAPANLMLVGTGNLTAFYAKGLMAAWARTEYEADVIDETGGTFTRIMAVRFVYDEPGKLVYGVKGNQATVKWGGNQAVVTAIGGVGPPGPANNLTIGDVETLEAGEPATASITGAAPNQELNLGLPKGDKGDKGWAPVFGLVADGERFVFVLAGWSGGEGPPPPITSGGLPVYVGAAGYTTDIAAAFDTRGMTGDPGPQGDKGWSPVLVAVPDGARRVLQVIDWIGGAGVKPATGDYLGDGALVSDIADAVDFRGPAGAATIPDGDKGDISTFDDGDTWLINEEALEPYLRGDGTATVTADIPLGGFKLTGVGDASAAADALNRQSGDARYHSILSGLGLNNRLINGQMRISQRGASFNANGKTLDRWEVQFGAGGVGTVAQNVLVQDDTITSMLWTMTTGGTSPYLSQAIEDARTLAGRRVCLSFDASLISGTTTLTPRLVQVFGTGGSPSSQVVVTGTPITITGGRVFQFLTLGTVVGKTFGSNSDSHLRIDLIAANGAVFSASITKVQLEEAPAAMSGPTPFERIPLALDFKLCRRYFKAIPTPIEVSYGAASPAQMVTSRLFAEPMRAAPAVSIPVAPTLANCTALTVTATAEQYTMTVTITGGAGQYGVTGVGLLYFSAELA
jgi:hypothetical protein